MEKLRVGIIGCGRISDLHYPGYKNNAYARIYAVCDANKETAETRKKQWKAEKCYTDFRELLHDPDVDAVEILTPHDMHERMVIDAVNAGKHVAVQKPLTISLESAERIRRAAAGCGTVVKVTDNYLFYPPIVLAKKIIDSGEIGDPVNMRIKFISGGRGGWAVPAGAWEWRVAERMQGRPFQTFDHGHHLWSTATFLQGDIEKVSAWIDSADGMVDCPSMILWKCAGGVRYGVCDYAHAPEMKIPSKYYGNDEWFEITGTRGMILIHRCTGNILEGPAVSLFNGVKWKRFAKVKSDWAEGFIGATKNFIESIRGRETPLLSLDQGIAILKLDLAIQKSGLLRRDVYIDEMGRRLPGLYSWRRRKMEIRRNPNRPRRFSFFGGGNLSKYAPQAVALTEGLMERFDAKSAGAWNTVIGLRLTSDGGIKEELFALHVRNGAPSLERGVMPADAVLVLTIAAGTWAGILLGKKRIEMALLQGKIKLEGKVEEGLRLREVFKL